MDWGDAATSPRHMGWRAELKYVAPASVAGVALCKVCWVLLLTLIMPSDRKRWLWIWVMLL